jgi:predicted MFS family arabinose efflux permease
VLLAAAGALLALVAESFGIVLVARLLQGLGQGPMLPLAATLVAQQWPPTRQGRLVGALSLAYGVAFLGATVATPVLLQWGWRAPFALSLATAAVTWVVSLRGMAAGGPDQRYAARAEAIGLSALLNREMVAIAVLSLGTGLGQAVLVWFPTLAIVRLGVPASATSVLMLPLVAGGIAATLGITAALDRVGARTLLLAGAVATLAGVLLAVATPASRWAFMVGAGALGLGITGLCGGPLRYAAARAVPSAGQGPAQSAVALLTNLGLLGGSVLLGALAARGRSELAGVQAALLGSCALMALSFSAVYALRPHRRPTGPPH